MHRFIIGMAVAILALPARAFDQDLQDWTLVTVQGHVTENVRLYGELQPRLALDSGALDRLLVRGAIGYDLSSQVSLWAGYAWTPLFASGFKDEQRPFEQLQVTTPIGGATLVNRTRFEQRFIAGADPSFRLRHMLRFAAPFVDGSPLRWVAYDEAFVNFNAATGGPPQGFDQNRAFVGLGWAHERSLFELGYLNNYVVRGGGKPDVMRHAIVLAAYFNWP